MPQRKSKSFFLLAQAMVLGLAPLVIWNGVSDNALYPQYIAWCFGLLVSLFLLFKESWTPSIDKINLPFSKALLPFIFLVAITASSCLWTRNPFEGVFEWTKFFFCIVWIIVLQQMKLSEGQILRNLPRIFLLVAATALAVGYIQLITAGILAGGLSHQITYQVDSLFAHRNLFAEALVLIFPYLLWVAFHEKGLWRILAAALVFLALAIVVVLQVRSAWLALSAGVFVAFAGAIFVIWRSRNKALWKPIGILLLISGMAIGLGMGIYSKTRQSGSLMDVGTSILNPTYGSALERKVQWQKTIQLIQQRPWMGCGLNGWRIEMLSTGYQRLRPDTQMGKVMIDRTHNDFLQLTAETGLLGGLSLLLTIVMAIVSGVRTLRRDTSGSLRLFAAVPMASLTSYAVIACFSFPMERISHLIFLATNLGILALLAHDSQKWNWNVSSRIFRTGLVVVALVVIAAGGLGLERIRADRHLIAALNQREKKDWAGMLKTLEEGESAFTLLDPTGTPFSWYAGSARNQLGDLKGALRDFQAAYKANPYHLHVLNNLGATWVQLGYPDSGLTYCQRAVELSPRFSEAWTNIGIIHFNSNRLDLAESALLKVQDSIPSTMTIQLATAVVESRIHSLLPSIDELQLQEALMAISYNKDWSLMVYQKAQLNKLKLRKQLFLEAIFTLEMGKKTITFEVADSLRSKYVDSE